MGLILAFIGVLLPVALITWGLLTGQSEVFLALAALASAGVMMLFGLIAVTQDARAGRPINRSNGLMSVGAGLLIILAVLILTQVVPLTGLTTTASASAMPDMTALMQQRSAALGSTDSTTATDSSATTSATLDTTLPSLPAGFALPGASSDTASATTDTTATTGDTAAASTTGSALPSAPAGFALPDSAAIPVSAESPAESAQTVTEPETVASMTLDDFMAGVLAQVGEVQVTPITAASAESVESTSVDASAADTSAAEPLAASAGTCQAVVRNNLNLRAAASADSERLLTIPYSTLLTIAAPTEDGWWQVTYDGQTGWVSGEFLDMAGACALAA